MNTQTELLKEALEYLEDNQHYIADNERHAYVMMYNNFIERIEKHLALEAMANNERELGIQMQPAPAQEPEFITHNVDTPYDWSDWVCPDPKGYLMKCCDCGLVHEVEFGVVRYQSETEREYCEMVDDPNLQAVFRMRRSEQWSPLDTAHRAGGLPMEQPEPAQHQAYEQANPLGGPAKVFQAMADAIRAGDSYHAVLRQYGYVEQPAPAQDDRNKLATWMMQCGFATGHGDTVEELLYELDTEVEARLAAIREKGGEA